MQKSYRIKKSQEIEQVMKRGRSKANPYFIVYKYANKETDNFRIAISVGKKVGKAFERNKIKRYIRNVTTEHKHEMNPDYDYFVIARKGVKWILFQNKKDYNCIRTCRPSVEIKTGRHS